MAPLCGFECLSTSRGLSSITLSGSLNTKPSLSVFDQFLSEIVQSLTRRRLISMEIIRDLFDGTVHYANTRKQALINNGTLVLSEEIQRYLMALSSTLDVAQWLKEQNNAPDRRRYGPLSKAVVERLRSELHRIADSLNSEDVSSPNTINDGNAFGDEPTVDMNVLSTYCLKVSDDSTYRFSPFFFLFYPKIQCSAQPTPCRSLPISLIVVPLFLSRLQSMSRLLRTSRYSE